MQAFPALRSQAKQAVQSFVQAVLDDPANRDFFARHPDKQKLARGLSRDALVLLYRLLFILKLEACAGPERPFRFATTTLWQATYSPSTALAPAVRKAVDEGAETGELLAGGLRSLFRLFREGCHGTEMPVHKLGGMLFGDGAAPLLDDERLHWSERAAANLLDHLLWTPRQAHGGRRDGAGRSRGRKERSRQRVHYDSLSVEDLGRIYEALLGLEPGIATEPMCRLRRQNLEVVVPRAQGDSYRADPGESPARGKTRVGYAGEIREGEFYLRAGLGRKATGSYYTPPAFVRFLIQETLGRQVAQRSPPGNPQPREILKLKVLDPAMGSGHFLVEACRYLGEKLYDACRACDLPGRSDALLAYLPNGVKSGGNLGLSDAKARALCRRLVAMHCLYGVDKDPLAVELAKLSLWFESGAENLPLTFLDHHLIAGDSLTGPCFEMLGASPKIKSSGKGYRQRLSPQLIAALAGVLTRVPHLEASTGEVWADIERRRTAKARLDKALYPFKVLAQAWSGGVMLGDQADDAAYRALMVAVAEGRDVQAVIAARPALAKMVEMGKEGVAYELTFPEVFYPEGKLGRRAGFHAVVGNPPWDALQPRAKEFYASFDLRILDAPTRLERGAVERRLASDPAIQRAFEDYVTSFESLKRLLDRCFTCVNRVPGGGGSGAVTDLWQAFTERGAALLRDGGELGMILPAALHANQSATGIRDLLLNQMHWRTCFSFENKDKLFEIDSRFKFALVVAARSRIVTDVLSCAFYLRDAKWLFTGRQPLRYKVSFIKKTGGAYLTALELRAPEDAGVAQACFDKAVSVGEMREQCKIRFGEEMHMSKASHFFTPVERVLADGHDPRDPSLAWSLLREGYLPLHEGKTFHQYTDRWEARPRYLVALARLCDKPGWMKAAQYYRLGFRAIASSTNERTGIVCLVPPGVLFGHSAPGEREPWNRPNATILQFLALANAYPFDWTLRQKSAANISLFILDGCPVPPSAFERPRSVFLAHSALRLTCNHEGYAALWREQIGDEWREPLRKHIWPVLFGDDARWAVRAAVDAVVAGAYGLTRDQYARVLSSFSHKSYPGAPELCLAAFDALQRMGLDAFVKAHDPYWDIPAVETLPEPVIELPGASGMAASVSTRPHRHLACW